MIINNNNLPDGRCKTFLESWAPACPCLYTYHVSICIRHLIYMYEYTHQHREVPSRSSALNPQSNVVDWNLSCCHRDDAVAPRAVPRATAADAPDPSRYPPSHPESAPSSPCQQFNHLGPQPPASDERKGVGSWVERREAGRWDVVVQMPIQSLGRKLAGERMNHADGRPQLYRAPPPAPTPETRCDDSTEKGKSDESRVMI